MTPRPKPGRTLTLNRMHVTGTLISKGSVFQGKVPWGYPVHMYIFHGCVRVTLCSAEQEHQPRARKAGFRYIGWP